MKVLTVIIALLVTMLSVAPCCLAENCTGEEVATEQNDRPEGEEEACSPFYSCSSCIGFAVSIQFFKPSTPVFEAGTGFFGEYQQFKFPQFHHLIWQPPKAS